MKCPTTPHKDVYTSRADAVTAAAGRVCRTGLPTYLRVYICEGCGAFHLTHKKESTTWHA